MSIYEILLGLIWHNPSKPNYALECNHGKGGGGEFWWHRDKLVTDLFYDFF